MISRAVADHATSRVGRAVGGFTRKFRPPVAIEIVDHELGVVGAGPDIAAEIDAPESCAIQFVGVEKHVARIAGLRVVLRVGRIPFQDDFVLTIAIEIGGAAIVCGVTERDVVGRATIRGWREGNAEVRANRRTGWHREPVARRQFLAGKHGADKIGLRFG
jgi:hypothetical protein